MGNRGKFSPDSANENGDVAAFRTPESGLSLVLMSYRGIEMRWRLFLTYVVLLSAAGTSLRAQQHLTLADVLQQESIPFPPASIPHLNALITSYATLNDSQGFLVAYYLADRGRIHCDRHYVLHATARPTDDGGMWLWSPSRFGRPVA
jgi:hypothetical protein